MILRLSIYTLAIFSDGSLEVSVSGRTNTGEELHQARVRDICLSQLLTVKSCEVAGRCAGSFFSTYGGLVLTGVLLDLEERTVVGTY